MFYLVYDINIIYICSINNNIIQYEKFENNYHHPD